MFQDVNQSSEHISEEGKFTNIIFFICNFPGGKNITYIHSYIYIYVYVKNERNIQGVIKRFCTKGLDNSFWNYKVKEGVILKYDTCRVLGSLLLH